VHHTRAIIILLCSCLKMASAQSDSTKPISQTRAIPNLAVLSLSGNSGVSAEDLQTVTSRLESELMRTGAFRVVERRNIDAILREQGFQQSGACNTSECQVEVGQILGVERIASGEITRMGKLWSMTVREVDVGTSALIVSHVLDIEGPLETVLRGGCPLMADILSGKTRPTESRTILQEKRSTTWLWVAGGAVIATGGIVAAVLLSRNEQSSAQQETPQREVTLSW